MSTDPPPDLAASVARIADALEGIREDLARREERRLKQAGAIPSGAPPRATGGNGGVSGVVFPNYGRSKGEPVKGATMQDYAAGARRSLADPGKARFHDKERALLAAIEAEIARQSGGQGQSSGGEFPDFGSPPPDDDGIPFVHCGGIR